MIRDQMDVSAKRSMALLARFFARENCSVPKRWLAIVCACLTVGVDDEADDREKSTSVWFAETEQTEVAVNPTGACTRWTATWGLLHYG